MRIQTCRVAANDVRDRLPALRVCSRAVATAATWSWRPRAAIRVLMARPSSSQPSGRRMHNSCTARAISTLAPITSKLASRPPRLHYSRRRQIELACPSLAMARPISTTGCNTQPQSRLGSPKQASSAGPGKRPPKSSLCRSAACPTMTCVRLWRGAARIAIRLHQRSGKGIDSCCPSHGVRPRLARHRCSCGIPAAGRPSRRPTARASAREGLPGVRPADPARRARSPAQPRGGPRAFHPGMLFTAGHVERPSVLNTRGTRHPSSWASSASIPSCLPRAIASTLSHRRGARASTRCSR